MFRIIFTFILLFSFSYADTEIKMNNINSINTRDVKNLLDNGGILIDIRTPMEWEATGIIEGAKQIMFYDSNANGHLFAFIKELLNNDITKQTPITLICNSGFRSKKALNELKTQGFINVNYVDGGILQWKKDSLPLVEYIK